MKTTKKYSRVVIKLSGESLEGEGKAISQKPLSKIAKLIKKINASGRAVIIVNGGGNLWRYRDMQDITALTRVESDLIGTMAITMNAVAIAAALREVGCDAVAFSAIPAPEIAMPYSVPAAEAVLNRGGVAVCGGGTGRPFVTSDTAVALRALELSADLIVKATTVDGIYTADPRKNKNATLIKETTYAEAIAKGYGVMDATAFAFLKDAKIPMVVCNFNDEKAFLAAAAGKKVGTYVHP